MKHIMPSPVKLSSSADLKIRFRLFRAQIKKTFRGLSFTMIALPALSAVIGLWGVSQFLTPVEQNLNTGSQGSLASRILQSDVQENSSEYSEKYKQKLYTYKAKRYQQYALVRSSSLRSSIR